MLVLLLLPACRKAEDPAEPITLFPPQTTAQSTNSAQVSVPPDSTPAPAANKTYGQTLSQIQSVPVLDTAEVYRTQDSYRLEQKAVQAAKEMFCAALYDPSTFTVRDSNLWNCVDDGENVYYSVYMKASYTVESGETIQSGFFGDVGIHKSDESAFDAADTIDDAVERYAAFRETTRSHTPFESADYEHAAKTIASERLKYPDSAVEMAVQYRGIHDAGTTDSVQYRQYDVFCQAENDYGMRIPSCYSVYLRSDGEKILEVDPAQA